MFGVTKPLKKAIIDLKIEKAKNLVQNLETVGLFGIKYQNIDLLRTLFTDQDKFDNFINAQKE